MWKRWGPDQYCRVEVPPKVVFCFRGKKKNGRVAESDGVGSPGIGRYRLFYSQRDPEKVLDDGTSPLGDLVRAVFDSKGIEDTRVFFSSRRKVRGDFRKAQIGARLELRGICLFKI